MRVLLVPDKPGWSIDRIAKALVTFNTVPSLALDVLPLKGNVPELLKSEHAYDRIFLLAHQEYEMLPVWQRRWLIDKDRWITGIHSHHSWDDGGTTPEKDRKPPGSLVRLLRRFHGVNAVSPRLTRIFQATGVNVVCTLNGVNTQEFRPLTALSSHGQLRVGFAGTAKGIHNHRKGYTECVLPAIRRSDVELLQAVARTETSLPSTEMVNFYNRCDVLLLPSNSEGCSLAMLEALACGRPVISTRVGGAVDAIQHDFNGYLVNRTIEAIVGALERLKDRARLIWMGENARATAVAEWSWEKRAPAWLTFLVT